MSEPESIKATITTYSLDGETWTTKRPPMCKIYYTREVPPISEVETSTIPTKLLEAFVALFRAAEAEVDHAMTWSCHEEDRMVDLIECVKEVIRLGGGK